MGVFAGFPLCRFVSVTSVSSDPRAATPSVRGGRTNGRRPRRSRLGGLFSVLSTTETSVFTSVRCSGRSSPCYPFFRRASNGISVERLSRRKPSARSLAPAEKSSTTECSGRRRSDRRPRGAPIVLPTTSASQTLRRVPSTVWNENRPVT